MPEHGTDQGDPLPVESYAAQELQYHIKSSTGAELPIVSENHDVPASNRVYLGKCQAAAAATIDPSIFPGNSYILRAAVNALYFAGKDTPCVMTNAWSLLEKAQKEAAPDATAAAPRVSLSKDVATRLADRAISAP